MNVREAQLKDLDAIVAIARECPEAPQWQPEHYLPFVSPGLPESGSADSPCSPLLRTAMVAYAAETILGFAAAALLLDGQENRCELESMAVLPDVRRQGVGTGLLKGIVGWAADHGACRIVLEVRAGNTAALRLYERCGLRVEGCRPRYYRDPEEDALLLAMPVTTVLEIADFSTRKTVEGGPPRC